MANCEKYQALTPIEKITFIGELIHAAQSDNKVFDMANDLIKLAIIKGVFDGVTINPIIEKITTNDREPIN